VGQGYYGYGKYRSGGSLPTDRRFTGQAASTTTDLYDYGARYYDPHIGMFISPVRLCRTLRMCGITTA
jgi:RHS repeat-associated protein